MILDSAIENVFQGMFAHKLKAQNPHCLAEFLMGPEVPDFFYCVNVASAVVYEIVKFTLIQTKHVEEFVNSAFIAPDVEDGRLPVIFRDVFGLVLVRGFASGGFLNRFFGEGGRDEQRIFPAFFDL